MHHWEVGRILGGQGPAFSVQCDVVQYSTDLPLETVSGQIYVAERVGICSIAGISR